MPWKETCAMKQRQLFIKAAELQEIPFAQLCQEFGISRKTGYKLLKRYKKDPHQGLVDKRTTRTFHSRYPAEIFENILALKLEKPLYGPEKLLSILGKKYPDKRWPSLSTTKQFLQRKGLTKKRRTYTPCPVNPPYLELREARRANDVWAIDFKGWFRTGDGRRCEPLTILDIHSRFLIGCSPVTSRKYTDLQPLLEAAFHEYGLPHVARSDNGPPFGSHGLARLSPLSVWFIKKGIYPEKIRPGHPEENGHLERFHRTLKAATAKPPAPTFEQQRQRFDKYRVEYNNERPHAALGQEPPAKYYQAGEYGPAPEYEYPEGTELIKVNSKGYIKIDQKPIFLTESLANETVGVVAIEESYSLTFLGYPLGTMGKERLQ